MKKIKTILGSMLIIIVIFALILDPAGFNDSIVDSLSVWLFKVYPAIFTFYILSTLLLNLGIVSTFSRMLAKCRFLFFKSRKQLDLFIVSIICGNPSSSSLIISEVEKKTINEKDASKMLIYSSFLSPLFIISFIDNFVFAIFLIISHILSNFIIAFFVNKGRDNYETLDNNKKEAEKRNIFSALMNVMEILVMIAAVMSFCNIIIYSISSVLSFFNVNNNYFKLVLSFLEISRGTITIINMPFPEIIKLAILSFLFGFGGISIHMQVYTIIKGKINYLTFLLGRLLQGSISAIIFIILYYLFW